MTLQEKTQSIRSAGRKGLAPFFTAGYPDEDGFIELIKAATRAGSDMIEIGIPFSDPIADGPVIQASSQRALEQGMSLKKALALTEKVSHITSAALVLMGYLNPFLQMGIDSFARHAKQAGASGVIVPDLPFEESKEIRGKLGEQGLTLIDLVAPTSSNERIAKMAGGFDGFLYLVSLTGVTGVRKSMEPNIKAFVNRVRAYTELPLYVGFGVSDKEMARETVRHADGVILGSALVKIINNVENRGQAIDNVEAFLSGVRAAIDSSDWSDRS
ncbi:MAG: tryptophan synthase subunit alpha [Planctomycetota bacterium]